MKKNKIKIEVEKYVTLEDLINKKGSPFISTYETIPISKKEFKELEDDKNELGIINDIRQWLEIDIKHSKHSDKYPCLKVNINKAIKILERIKNTQRLIKSKKWMEAMHECLYIGMEYEEYTLFKEYEKVITDRVNLIRANPPGVQHRLNKPKIPSDKELKIKQFIQSEISKIKKLTRKGIYTWNHKWILEIAKDELKDKYQIRVGDRTLKDQFPKSDFK